MKIKWYGHAAFLITSDQGIKIILDPYEPGAFGGQLSYGKIPDAADIVLTSHDHADHNFTKGLPGNPEVVRGSGVKTIKGISIKGIPSYHDPSRGKERGENVVFNLLVDGIQLCHLGDLGHVLEERELREIGSVDILLVPIGGYFTIDAGEATQIVNRIKPRVVIPMHFKTEKCAFPIAPVDDFLKDKPSFKRMGSSEVSYSKATLPPQMEIVVLEHSL